MNKAHVTHLLSEFIEGNLPTAGSEKVKAHLSFCNACRSALAETERNITLLKATPAVALPKGLEGRVLAAVERELGSPIILSDEGEAGSFWSRWFSPLRGLALAATCAVAFLVVRSVPVSFEKAQVLDHVSTARDAESKALVGAGRRAGETDLGGAGYAQWKSQDKPDLASNEIETSAQSGPPAAPPAPAAPAEENKSISQVESQSRSDGAAAPLQKAARQEAQKNRDSSAFPMAGSQSGIETALETALSSQANWEALWKRHSAIWTPPPVLPAVNFETDDVIAIFGGQQPSGGYRVELIRIENTAWNGGTARMVRYRISTPPADAVTTQVITTPYLFVIQPHFEGQTFFERSP